MIIYEVKWSVWLIAITYESSMHRTHEEMNRVFVVFLVAAVWLGTVAQCSPVAVTARPPAVAGSFYPADSAELRQLVEGQLAMAADSVLDGDPIAFIVPHAGLVYSGPIAAFTYRLLSHYPVKRVILCGPSHHVAFHGLSVFGPGVMWKTPLGEVRCDDDLCSQIIKAGAHMTTSAQPHLQEHCLEVQLPFLQTVLKSFRIVPIVMGEQDPATIDDLAKALGKLAIDSTTIMIASSDWQHYRPASVGHIMDSIGVACLRDLNPDELAARFSDGSSEACGRGPILAVMKAAIAKGADEVRILKVGDSGDATGDKSSVVGYVAAVLYRSRHRAEKGTKETAAKLTAAPVEIQSSALSHSDQQKLLEIARQSIIAHLTKSTEPQFDVSPALKVNGAAFVTLTENGQLRGCIGTIQAQEPLYLAVSHCAVSAAISDPRFKPVTADEIPRLRIEISVLTPLTKVADFGEIQVGRDGLMIRLDGCSGLLLPQVATEYGWDRTTFLEQTCIKAGLPRNAYLRPGATICRFQATVFDEVLPAKHD
jgi:MEMO1 family protein